MVSNIETSPDEQTLILTIPIFDDELVKSAFDQLATRLYQVQLELAEMFLMWFESGQ